MSRSAGRGTPAHRTEADVPPTSSSVLFRPDDVPGVRIIIPAAVAVMAERGYHATTVRDIGQRADMSATALYHHFPSKQLLLVSIMERMFEYLWDECARAEAAAMRSAGHAATASEGGAGVGSTGEAAARLRARVRAQVLVNIELRRRETVLVNAELRSVEPPHDGPIVARRDRFEAALRDVVEAGIRDGEFGTHIPHDVVRGILGMVGAVPAWYRPDGPLPPHEVADRYAALALTMVEHRP